MLNYVLIGLEIFLAIVITTVVLMQPSKSDGLKGFLTGSSDTFFSRNKSRTKEALLARITVISSILFAVNTLALNLISK